MYNFYSVSGQAAGVDQSYRARDCDSLQWSIALTFIVSILFADGIRDDLLEAYEHSADWDVLNKLICQWRAAEDRTRAECGLPSIDDVSCALPTDERGNVDPVDTSSAANRGWCVVF
jgi:hypothetical protein